MSLRCSIYARYSSDQQKPTSIDDQIRECREAALTLGWLVLPDQLYADQAISGAAADRPGLKRLLQAARLVPRAFDVLLLDDTSRLARNVGDSTRIIESCFSSEFACARFRKASTRRMSSRRFCGPSMGLWIRCT